MHIKVQRIYDRVKTQGYRILVDRLWPRGISKEEANLDDWWKDIAPSSSLRKWFGHDTDKWKVFCEKYTEELIQNEDKVQNYIASLPNKDIILLYAAKDPDHTHALFLKQYLEKLLNPGAS